MNLPDTIASPTNRLAENHSRYVQGLSNAIHFLSSAADQMRQAYNSFWSLPDDELIALLNREGPERINAVFTSNTILGSHLNAAFDEADPTGEIFGSHRIPVVPAKNIAWNEELQTFEILPPE